MIGYRAILRTAQMSVTLIALVFCNYSVKAQSLIQITSPTAGTVVYRGSTLQVTFTADSSVTDFVFTGGGVDRGFAALPGTNTYSVPVPADAEIKRYQIHVLGLQNGHLIASAAVPIQIEDASAILSITSELHNLIFQAPGDIGTLLVRGTFADGSSAAYVNGSTRVSFVSQNPLIATVDTSGNVSAVAAGATTITVLGAFSGPYVVPVVVSAGPAPAPVLFPAPGNYIGSQSVTISDVARGAVLYYTTDGSLPTTQSNRYTRPLSISSTETVNALAVVPDGRRATAWGTYTIELPGKESTATAISTSPSTDLIAGEKLTVTVIVKPNSGSAIPTGTVTLADPASTHTVTVPLGSDGTAVYETKVPAPGSYELYAVYNGSASFAGSTSPTLSATVK